MARRRSCSATWRPGGTDPARRGGRSRGARRARRRRSARNVSTHGCPLGVLERGRPKNASRSRSSGGRTKASSHWSTTSTALAGGRGRVERRHGVTAGRDHDDVAPLAGQGRGEPARTSDDLPQPGRPDDREQPDGGEPARGRPPRRAPGRRTPRRRDVVGKQPGVGAAAAGPGSDRGHERGVLAEDAPARGRQAPGRGRGRGRGRGWRGPAGGCARASA